MFSVLIKDTEHTVHAATKAINFHIQKSASSLCTSLNYLLPYNSKLQLHLHLSPLVPMYGMIPHPC